VSPSPSYIIRFDEKEVQHNHAFRFSLLEKLVPVFGIRLFLSLSKDSGIVGYGLANHEGLLLGRRDPSPSKQPFFLCWQIVAPRSPLVDGNSVEGLSAC